MIYETLTSQDPTETNDNDGETPEVEATPGTEGGAAPTETNDDEL
jgi:hypothetical protein